MQEVQREMLKRAIIALGLGVFCLIISITGLHVVNPHDVMRMGLGIVIIIVGIIQLLVGIANLFAFLLPED
jgi:uncharacterized membrane protein YidH (DUF202 family)